MIQRAVGRAVLRLGIGLAVVVAVDRILAALLLGDDLFLGRPVAPFDPPLFSASQSEVLTRIEAQLAAGQSGSGKFDAALGWCNKPDSGFGDYRYDWAGARIGAAPLERLKPPGVRRAVAVGCSMTHGDEVGAVDSWCARTDAALPDLEVANLGVAAYGIDQALLRLRRDGWLLEPDEVWLGVLPQAALRVTTLYRPVLDHWSLDVAFKPRFELDSRGELVLLENPAASLADVPRLLSDQGAFLEAMSGRDPWVTRARLAYSSRGSSWAHGSLTARLFLTAWERGGRKLESCFQEESQFGRLFSAIVRSMEQECTERGILFRLLILPGRDDFDAWESGHGYWTDWAKRLGKRNIRVFDVTSALIASAIPRERLFAAQGHYTSEGCAVVARALVSELAR